MSASQAAAEDAALVNVTFEGKPCAVPAGKQIGPPIRLWKRCFTI